MRSSIHGTFATLLLLIPVGAIPALAIFGIPQFAPVVASPLHEGHEKDRERGIGESARAPADDLLFHDDAEFPTRGGDTSTARGRLGDSVPVPKGNAKRSSSPDQFAETPSRLPSWAEDPPVEDSRPLAPGRNEASPRSDSGPNRFAPQRSSDFEQGGGDKRLDGNKLGNSAMPAGYRRQREQTVEPVTPAPRENTNRDSLTWDGLHRRLNELEIRNFRLEPSRQANQFIFICSYTLSDSPRVSRRFEAESDEPLKAVEKVIVQIEEWQQQHR